MKKDYPITKLDDQKGIQALDNLLSNIFNQAQDKEHLYYEFTGADVWIKADSIGEKQIIICKNVTDDLVRIYTKIAGNLKYVQFS